MPRILIVDDDPATLSVLKKILCMHNHQVIGAESAEQAFRELETNPGVDLIITDIEMPEITGLEMVKRFSEQPCLSSIPIIICSGNSDRYTLLRSFKTGAVDFIAKPITVNTLIDKIDSALAKAKASVLVMMDEPEECDHLTLIINQGGFEVMNASTVETGLEMLRICKINIAIIDVSLPGMSDKYLAGEIKRKYPNIPILLLTGLSNEYSDKIAPNFGYSGCISMPLNSNSIITELHNQLKSIPSDSFA